MWQPIETAPKDGTRVDLYMMNERGEGWREADAYWVNGLDDEHYTFLPDGSWMRVNIKRSGWWAPNHGWDGEDGWADCPRYYNEHPKQRRWIWTEPTHWMPLPEPPQ